MPLLPSVCWLRLHACLALLLQASFTREARSLATSTTPWEALPHPPGALDLNVRVGWHDRDGVWMCVDVDVCVCVCVCVCVHVRVRV